MPLNDNADDVRTLQEAAAMMGSTDFSKIRVGGVKTLADAILDVGSLKKINPKYGSKNFVLGAINKGNLEQMREVSISFIKQVVFIIDYADI